VYEKIFNLIANKTANIAEYIVFVPTFRISTGVIVNAKDQTHSKLSYAIAA